MRRAAGSTPPEGIEAVVDVISDRAALLRMAGTLSHGGRLTSTVHSADEAAPAARLAKRTAPELLYLGFQEQASENVRLAPTVSLSKAYEAGKHDRRGVC